MIGATTLGGSPLASTSFTTSGASLTITVSETLTLGEGGLRAPGLSKAEALSLIETYAKLAEIVRTDTATVTDSATRAVTLSLPEELLLSDSAMHLLAKALVELLGMTDLSAAQLATITAAVNTWRIRVRGTVWKADPS